MIKNPSGFSKLLVFFLYFFVFAAQASDAPITPTEVFIEAKALKNALAELATREKQKLTIPQVDIDVSSAEPRHVYSMTAALNEKIGFYLSLKGQKEYKRLSYPTEKITPGSVLNMVKVTQENLKAVHQDIPFQREPTKDKKPADVFRELTYANLWMDEFLQDASTPALTFRYLNALNSELDTILTQSGITPPTWNPARYDSVKPGEVFSSAGNFYRLLARFDGVHSGVSGINHPYNIPSSGILVKPIHVFTLTVFNLNFLYSVELKLGIKAASVALTDYKEGLKPADIYQGYDLANAKLAYFIANAGNKKQ